MDKKDIVYEEYFATNGEGTFIGYFENYESAKAAVINKNGGAIFGAHYVSSSHDGLLQRVWSEIGAV